MMIPKARTAILMLMVIILPGIVLLDAADQADGAGELRATIELDPYEPNVDVDPQRGGVITYTGRVVTTQPRDFDFQFGILSLTAECTAGWEVTEIPTLTVRLGLTTVPFSVSVFVPQLTTATEQDTIHKIIISGSWVYEPGLNSGTIDPAEAFIHVNQVYQYSIISDPGYVQTAPGGQFDLELTIENKGNGADEIEVVIDRRDKMEDNGWAFIIDRTHFELPYKGNQKINVRVTTPNRWDGWRNVISVIRFQVSSTQASQNSDVSEVVYYSVYVRQRGVSVPGFEVPLMLAAVMLVAIMAMRRRR
jgi:hypothetical protein